MISNENTLSLAEMKPDESACIIEVDASAIIRQRLRELGLRDGAAVTVVRSAPLNDPIEVKLQGGYVSIRRAEAAKIKVARI